MNGHWLSTIIPASSVTGLWKDTGGVHYTRLKCDRAMKGHWWSTLYQAQVWLGYEWTLVEYIIPGSSVTGLWMDTGGVHYTRLKCDRAMKGHWWSTLYQAQVWQGYEWTLVEYIIPGSSVDRAMKGHWWSTLYQAQVWQGYEWTLVEYIIPGSSVTGLWKDTGGVHYTRLKCDRVMNGHWWSTLYQAQVWQGYERTLVEYIIPVSCDRAMNGHWWSTLYQAQVWQGYEWTLVEYIIPGSSVTGLWKDTGGVHYTRPKCDRAMNGHWGSTLYQSHVWQGCKWTLGKSRNW